MRKIIAMVAGVLAAGLIIACGSGDKVTSTGQGERPANGGAAATANLPNGPKKFNVGEHATLTLGSGSTADIVVSSVQMQGKSVVAMIMIQCTSGTISYNVFDWTASAADGTRLDMAYDPTVKNDLHSGDLASGQKITGMVAFEGNTAKGVTVTYMSAFSALAYWVNP